MAYCSYWMEILPYRMLNVWYFFLSLLIHIIYLAGGLIDFFVRMDKTSISRKNKNQIINVARGIKNERWVYSIY